MATPLFSRHDELARRLRELRERQRLTQSAVAQAADIEPALLSRYESGEHAPSLAALERLLPSLRVTLSELLDFGSEPPLRKPDLDPAEAEILALWRELPLRHQRAITQLLRVIAGP